MGLGQLGASGICHGGDRVTCDPCAQENSTGSHELSLRKY